MKRVVWKHFALWKLDEEEKWLNKMGEEGYNLVDVKWMRYIFERGQAGKYQYATEYLEKSSYGRSGQEYIEFLADAGIELVKERRGRAYFCREKRPGKFQIYTDPSSKIKHFNRMISVMVLWVLFFGYYLFERVLALVGYDVFKPPSREIYRLELFLGILLTAIILNLFRGIFKLQNKKKDLRAQRKGKDDET